MAPFIRSIPDLIYSRSTNSDIRMRIYHTLYCTQPSLCGKLSCLCGAAVCTGHAATLWCGPCFLWCRRRRAVLALSFHEMIKYKAFTRTMFTRTMFTRTVQ